ncbi:MAG: hypothetical protein LBC71_03200 [Oscillospiraceae bacterium]|jgi:hypothetical protein|nr:hypothetical protein [Oscillospiraceae bacterium]
MKNSNGQKKWNLKKIIAICATLAVFVGLFVFITGIDSIPEIFRLIKGDSIYNPTFNTTPNPTDSTTPIQTPTESTTVDSHEDSINPSPSLIENNYRFDLYDDSAVLEKINAINNELAINDNLSIDAVHLKNFIYLMNGDYSLANDDERDFYSIIDMLCNLNFSIISNLPSFDSPYEPPKSTNDVRTLLTRTPDIFRRQADYDFIRTFTDAQNKAIDTAYETLCLEETRPFVDNLFYMFVEVFINKNAIRTEKDLLINPGNLSTEALCYILLIIMPQNMQMAINYGDDYKVFLGDSYYTYQSVFNHLTERSAYYSSLVLSRIHHINED